MVKTVGMSKYAFIDCEKNPELVEALEAELFQLTQLKSWDGLKKNDLILEVHDSCVSQGAGTSEQKWVPITTVRVTQITRLNPKTYGFKLIEGYDRHSLTGKYIKGYVFNEGQQGPSGFRDNRRYFII